MVHTIDKKEIVDLYTDLMKAQDKVGGSNLCTSGNMSKDIKQKILDKVKETSTDNLIDFLEENGVSSWKLSLASRSQIESGIEKELDKYTEKQLYFFYEKHFS